MMKLVMTAGLAVGLCTDAAGQSLLLQRAGSKAAEFVAYSPQQSAPIPWLDIQGYHSRRSSIGGWGLPATSGILASSPRVEIRKSTAVSLAEPGSM